MEQSTTRFIPALEGVRGYAFLIVFLVHYQASSARPTQLWQYPWFLLMSAGWLVVPLFFALSGYLITQVLYNSKDREGYFRVFYGRRALRVFPIYYITLAICFAVTRYRHWCWSWHNLGYLFYLQNFARHPCVIGNHILASHFWSLAVEEHFYLVWPVVIRLCRTRKQLLRCCYGVLIGCFALRVAWPLAGAFGVPLQLAYLSTLTRVDGIICGAIIAIATREHGIAQWLKTTAVVTVLGGLAVLFCTAAIFGHSKPEGYAGIVWMTPLANVISSALLLLLLRQETWLSRACSKRWICKFGSLSYGLYIFHFLYAQYFVSVLAPRLALSCGPVLAGLACMVVAFCITWALAAAAYQLIELPGQKAKRFLKYGPTLPARGERTTAQHDRLVNAFG